jgi:nicotinate-nucleotide adenylyltransferase
MLGLLGGTFDPIHYGHLRPAEEVYRRLGLESLQVIPCATPPHRKPPLASAAHRLRMVELALEEFPGFVADDREVRRGGVSYTVPTLVSVRDEIGDEPLSFIVGSDAFAGIRTWHRWEDLFGLAHLIVVQRPGSPASTPAWAAPRVCTRPKELAQSPAGRIFFMPVTPRAISATELRAAVGRGDALPADCLPRSVWEYIQHNKLYRSLST